MRSRPDLRCLTQALFRPVSMCIPDLALICEIMLMAEGFQQSKVGTARSPEQNCLHAMLDRIQSSSSSVTLYVTYYVGGERVSIGCFKNDPACGPC